MCSNEIVKAFRNLIDEYIEKYDHVEDCIDINNGLCEQIAKDVKKRVDGDIRNDGDVIMLWERQFLEMKPDVHDDRKQPVAHMWIYDGEKHYDACTPEGTTDFRDLSVFDNIDLTDYGFTEEDFKSNKFIK